MGMMDAIGGGYPGGERGFFGAGPSWARMATHGGGPGSAGFWGDPRPALRAADARLPGYPGDRRAHRGHLAPQPGLGLPGAAAARGRGPGCHREGGRPEGGPPDRDRVSP